jgi:hypothetical protein
MALRIREVNRLRFNKLIHLGVVLVARIKWRETYNHLIGQDA